MSSKGKMTLLIFILFILCAVGFFTKSFAEEKPRVVVVLKELDTQYWKIIEAGVRKGFKDFDIDGKVIAPKNGTAEEQQVLLEDVLKEKPDVLVMSPISPKEIIPVLDKFVEAGIPTVFLDTNDPWNKKTTYVGTDNLELGKKAGQLLSSQLQPGDKVALVGGDLGVSVLSERILGAQVSLEEAGIHAITKNIGASNEDKLVKKGMEELLKEHPDVKGIMAVSDLVAIQALEVLKEHDLSIPVTGADGITEMLELIENGTLSGSVSQNPYDMGYLSIETVVKIIKGAKVEKNIDSGVDIIIKGNAGQRLNFLRNVLK